MVSIAVIRQYANEDVSFPDAKRVYLDTPRIANVLNYLGTAIY